MKMAIISDGFTDSSIHALPWKYAYELSKGLAERGHEVHIFTDTVSSESIHGVNGPKIQVTCYGPSVTFLSAKSEVNRLSQMINSIDPDAIYCFTSLVGDLGLKYLGPRKNLFLHVSHNTMGLPTYIRTSSLSKPSLFASGLFADSLITARLYKCIAIGKMQFKLVNASTETIKESLIRIGYNASKIRVLPLVVDDLFLKCRSEVNAADVLHNENFTGVYFGAGNPKRGVLELVKSVPIIKKHIPTFKLLLLLRPPVEPNYLHAIMKVISKTECSKNVSIVDELLRPETLIDYLCRSHIVILPFRYLDEEPPLSLLEAMALGKPVVTTRMSCIKYIVGKDRGVLVDHISPRSIAHAIHSLYHNEHKMELIKKKSSSFACNTFVGWSDIVSVIEKEISSD